MATFTKDIAAKMTWIIKIRVYQILPKTHYWLFRTHSYKGNYLREVNEKVDSIMQSETYICLSGRHQSTTERKNSNKFVNDCVFI